MPKMPAVVSKKVGPLPLWGWLIAGGAAVFVAMKLRGGGSSSSAGPGTIALPDLAPGSQLSSTGGLGDTTPIVSPAQNVIGGMDTAPGGVPPWWSGLPAWWNATPGIPLNGPSTNGSSGHAGPVMPPLSIDQARTVSGDFTGMIGTPAAATASINAARQNPSPAPVGATADTASFFDRMRALGVVQAAKP